MTEPRPAPLPWWQRPLPWRLRGSLLVAAALLVLVACNGELGVLRPVDAEREGAPTIASVEHVAVGPWGLLGEAYSGAFHPAGREWVLVRGTGLDEEYTVWLGQTQVYAEQISRSADGTSLLFRSPPTDPGATLDVGVGLADDFGEEIELLVVKRQAYTTTGLSATHVACLGVLIAVLALLGTPLFVVIASITCLGLYLETQLASGSGFFTRHDPREVDSAQGKGVNLFISWLSPMGDSQLFIAIPLFTFAGTLLSESKAPTRLINLCRAFVGWLPGGLSLVTLTTCCILTAFTGASGVTIIALGGLLFPVLLREGYPERFSLGLLTTGGSLGLLFPPSLPVIVYGVVTHLDVKRLYQATLVPGILLVALLALLSFGFAILYKVPRHSVSESLHDLPSALRGALWELPLPVIVLGGIMFGFIAPEEAAAVTAFYVVITTVVIYKDLAPKDLLRIVRKTAVLVGAILLIVGTALGFSDWLSLVRIPQMILGAMQEHIHSQLTFLIMLNLFLLLVGCLMDIFSATLVVVPLIAPVALEFGVDPYHLAAIFLVNLEIGYSTPPVGINLFIASLRFRRPVFALYRASLLFIGVLLIALLAITYIPFLSLGFFQSELPKVSLPDGPLTVEQWGDLQLEPTRVAAGDEDLTAAEARQEEAQRVFAAAQEREGISWAKVESQIADIEAKLNAREGDPGELRARRKELERQREPLRRYAQELDAARRLVADLEQMSRTVSWRSRTSGQTEVGPRFSLGDLKPGEHLVTATVIDKRGHVAQAQIRVTVTAAPDEEGEDDVWVDDEGDEGGNDEDSGEDGDDEGR
ncbi:MAG: TRAP transporter large permease subunit [Planctomycetes bacterium]|nr:TRAP transporter large permease subunit [Planctomycetota bacterium]